MEYVLFTALAILCILPLTWKVLTFKKYDLFSISIFFPLMYFLYHGIGTFFTMTRNYILGTDTRDVAFNYKVGLLYAIIGIICFFIGLSFSSVFAKAKLTLAFRKNLNRTRINYFIIILILFYVGANFAIWLYLGDVPLFISDFYSKRLVLLKGMGYVWELGIFSMIPVSVMMLALLMSYKDSSFWKAKWGIAFCIIVFVLCIANQSRGAIMSLIIPLTIFVNYKVRRVKLFHTVLIFFFLILVILSATFLRYSSSSNTNEEKHTAYYYFFSEIFTETDNYYDVIKNVPDKFPYQYGKTLIPLITNPIPRFLFPGKKKFKSAGAIYKDLRNWEEILVGVRITLLGEFYLNLGLIGIIIGMFLWGLLNGFIIKNLYPGFSGTNPLKPLLYSFTVFCLYTYIAGDIVAATMYSVQYCIPIFLFLIVFGKVSFYKISSNSQTD